MARKSLCVALLASAAVGLISVLILQSQNISLLATQSAALSRQNVRLASFSKLVPELQRLKLENRDLQRYRAQAFEVHSLRHQVATFLGQKHEYEHQIADLRLQIPTYSTNLSIGSARSIIRTGRPWDLAILGSGFFELLLPDGKPAYTRYGNFSLTSDGVLVTENGLTVVSLGQMPPDAIDIAVSSAGDVALSTASGAQVSLRVQLARFQNPEALEAIAPNLYIETSGSGPAEPGNPGENGFGLLAQGFQESTR
jgi:flagellar basal body rod protein FlgG